MLPNPSSAGCRHPAPSATASGAAVLAQACRHVLQHLLADPYATVRAKTAPVERLERRYLLTSYSPGGDGSIGTYDFPGGTLASEDRVVIDYQATSGGLQQDVFNVTGATTLGGLLDLNALDTGALAAGDVLTIATTSGDGSLSGGFHAIDGLAANAAVDFALVQSPSAIALVATNLPTGDFTISVADDADFNNLVQFFTDGTAASTTTVTQAGVHFLGQAITGDLAFSYDGANQALDLVAMDNQNAAFDGRLRLRTATANFVTLIGTGDFTVLGRVTQTPGLQIDEGGFDAQQVSIGSPLGGDATVISRFGQATVGPLTFNRFEGFLAEGGFVFTDQTLDVTVGFRAQSATLAFTQSDGTAPDGGNNGVTAEVGFPELAVNCEASYDVAAGALSPLAPDGGFTGYVSNAELSIPGLFTAKANYNIEFGYDPDGPADQTFFAAGEVELQLANLPVYGKISQGNFSLDYAFTLRQDGFEFANFEIGLNTDDGTGGDKTDTGTATTGPVRFGNAVTIHDPKLIFSNFAYDYGEAVNLDGTSVSLAASKVDIGPDAGNFQFTGTGVKATLELGDNGVPNGFKFLATSLGLTLGRYFSASATNIIFYPTAADDQDLLLVNGSINASLNLNSLPNVDALQLSGTMSAFSIRGDGSFNALPGFTVGFGIDAGLTQLMGGVEFPSFFSIGGSGNVSLSWPDFNAEPDRFVMMLSASVDLSFGSGASPIALSGEFTNLAIDTKRIEAGEFPIIGVESVAISGSVNVFGGNLDASLILGTVLFDDQGGRLNYSTALMKTPDRIADSVIYAGVEGGFTIAGKGGFHLMLGLSELGPLMGYVRADVPILLDHHTGLTLDGFRGGITFNATAFPDITDPIDLRAGIFQPTRDLTREQWMTQLQNLVVNQKGGNPGFLFTTDADWTSDLNAGFVPNDEAKVLEFKAMVLEYGYALSKIPGVIEVTPLEAGKTWLLDDRGTQFLITRSATGVFSVSSIGFNIDGEWVDDLPSGAGTNTAGNISVTTGDETKTLVDIFAESGVSIADSAVVRETEAGAAWEIVDGEVTFHLTKYGVEDPSLGEVRLIVTGGNGTFAVLDQVIKLEAGASIYSQYVGKEFFNLEADIIFTTDGNLLLAGDANWLTDPTTQEPTFQQQTRIYFNLEDLAAGTGKIFYLSDMPLLADDPTAGRFSIHGFLAFGFLDEAGTVIDGDYLDNEGVGSIAELLLDSDPTNDPDTFKLTMAGSETQGIAVADFGGLQRFRLGGKADPNAAGDPNLEPTQYGKMTLSVSDTQLKLAYDANLSSEGLLAADSFLRSAGKFVLDFEDDFEMWGVGMVAVTSEDIMPLTAVGITAAAEALLQFNVSPQDRDVVLDIPGEGETTFTLARNSFGLYLSGKLAFEPPVVGGVLHQEIVGAFALEISQDEGLELLALGTMPVPLPLIGAVASPLQADVLGAMVINADGFAGRLELNLRDDLLDGSEAYFDFNAALGLYINSTGEEQQVTVPARLLEGLVDYLPDTINRSLQPPTVTDDFTVAIPAGAPKAGYPADPTQTEAAGPYIVIQGSGNLSILSTVEMAGDFRLAYRYDEQASKNFFEFEADASMELAPLGMVHASGVLVIEDDAGDLSGLDVYGAFELTGSLDTGFFSLSGVASIEFNSHDTPQTIDRYYDVANKRPSFDPIPTTIEANSLRVFVGGELQILNSFTFHGAFTLANDDDKLAMTVDAELRSLFDIVSLDIDGNAEIYSDGGLVLNVALEDLNLGFDPLLEIGFDQVALEVDTRVDTYRISVDDLTVSLLEVIEFDGSASIGMTNGVFEVDASISADFFDFAGLDGDLYFNSLGEWSFSIHGELDFTIDILGGELGVTADADISASYLRENQDPTIVLEPNDLRMSFGGSFSFSGLDLLGLSAEADGEFYITEDNTLMIEVCASIQVEVDLGFGEIGFETESACVDFAVGTLNLPAVHPATRASDGTLYVNVGSRAHLRDFAENETEETVLVQRAGSGTNFGDRLLVTVNNRSQVYDNVTNVIVYAGNGDDQIEIASNVRVPTTLTGGTGVDTILGGGGDDTIVWRAGDGADTLIQGRGGNDTLSATFTDNSDQIELSLSPFGQVRVDRLSGASIIESILPTSGIDVLHLDLGAGGDTLAAEALEGTGLNHVRIDFGNDSAADHVILDGRSVADRFAVTNSGNTLNVSHDGVMSYSLTEGNRASNDRLTLLGRGGDDHFDASNVGSDLMELELVGHGGNDRLIGSSFDDTLNSGVGDDTVTGNAGTDTFFDAAGSDSLLETRDRDMTLTDDSFIVGTVTASASEDFADHYDAGAEVEDLKNIFEFAALTGGAGNNRIMVGDVDGIVTVGSTNHAVARRWTGTVDLDAVNGSDRYIVSIPGDGGAIVNVSDSGTTSGESNALIVNGSESTDQFLLRPTFVATLAGWDGEQFTTLDRVNYDATLTGGMTLNGLGGGDHFASDDNGVRTTLNGGLGDDTVQIGQMFNADRVAPYVAAGEELETTETTVGYVTNGVTHELTANGGEGDDQFVVFRNLAELYLNGEVGSDAFTVRAFALASSGQVDPDQKATDINGGDGADNVEYAANAPVNINGGDGLDIVRVLGTEFGDRFVVTDAGIWGAGVSVLLDEVEFVELHTGDGDDEVYIVSTTDIATTTVFGGRGSDHFYVGETPAPVVATDPPDFTGHQRVLTGIQGPLFLMGSTGDETVFNIPDPVMLPTESDAEPPADEGTPEEPSDEPEVDVLDVVDVDATADDVGALSRINLAGLGMGDDLTLGDQTFAGGVTYGHLEIIDIALGSGGETLAVTSIADFAITLIHGNAGDDTFHVSAPEADEAMLVLYGDTAASSTHRANPGDDHIDARLASHGATYYGGAGNDTISGGTADDRIAGGSGNDHLDGGSARDLILGDSGLDVDRDTRITTLVTAGMPAQDDFEQPGDDTLEAGTEDDIVFGDHGTVTQVDGVAGILAPAGVVALAETTNESIGGDDRITAAGGNNLIFAGAGADTINSGAGNDVVIGDNGIVTLTDGALADVRTRQFGIGNGDTVTTAGGGDDIVLGGAGGDDLGGGDDQDILLGDEGEVRFNVDEDLTTLDRIEILAQNIGAGDTLRGDGENDLLLGSAGRDDLHGGAGDDLLFGDYGLIIAKPGQGIDLAQLLLPPADRSFTFESVNTTDDYAGDSDTMNGGDGDDILLGGQGGDRMRGDVGDDDLIGGHNVAGGSDAGDTIDGGLGNDVIAGDNARIERTNASVGPRMRTLAAGLLYDDAGNALVTADSQANPTGAEERFVELFEGVGTSQTGGSDRISGGAQDDVIFGQFANDLIEGDGDIDLDLTDGISLEDFAGLGSDGDDYIEGNAGDDVLLGNLGQDDLIGGSSDLFGYTTIEERSDGADTLYGGAGTRTDRYDAGDTSETGHARDADVILGDNGRILRIVGTNATPGDSFLAFTYDYYSTDHIVVRAVETLDYSADGIDNDLGADDLLLGEGGDDSILGMAGNDVIFGHGQDDDLIGGGGHDRLYGGNGEDGVIGDDGFVRTSRNGLTETLHGLTSPNEMVNYSIPGPFTGSWEYITGRLLKVAVLLAADEGAADVIYGGTGDDFLHAGAGDDAVSGAEATAEFYTTDRVTEFDPLGYDPTTRKLADYDADNPREKIEGFLLNFDTVDANGDKIEDGKDRIFGDNGHDWLVGGTGNDRLFGGRGDDLMNADDNHDTNGGLNDQPDDPEFAGADFVYGGAGLDVLIANTGGDRMFDWSGEFNSFIVPFSPFGAPTVNRSPSPHIRQFLADLGLASGADPLLAEPHGELGLYDQGDADWGTNKGGPRDPQPGNGRARRDTRGGPEDDRHTALPLTGPGGGGGWGWRQPVR